MVEFNDYTLCEQKYSKKKSAEPRISFISNDLHFSCGNWLKPWYITA